MRSEKSEKQSEITAVIRVVESVGIKMPSFLEVGSKVYGRST